MQPYDFHKLCQIFIPTVQSKTNKIYLKQLHFSHQKSPPAEPADSLKLN
ncbi:hypothetical protein PSE_5024 [Pseudovibrio sp. FO-BEG1]|nr:hypothetical protein PSE_5024 [Pseudovibrio sp. FO-BEG1]